MAAGSAGKLARLTIDGKEYNVFKAGLESYKPTDSWNRVTAFATKATAKFVIEGKEDSTTLFEKYANSRKRFDAKLTLYNTHSEGKLAETEYKECSISYYSSSYNASDDCPYTITIVLSPKTIIQGSGELTFDQNS